MEQYRYKQDVNKEIKNEEIININSSTDFPATIEDNKIYKVNADITVGSTTYAKGLYQGKNNTLDKLMLKSEVDEKTSITQQTGADIINATDRDSRITNWSQLSTARIFKCNGIKTLVGGFQFNTSGAINRGWVNIGRVPSGYNPSADVMFSLNIYNTDVNTDYRPEAGLIKSSGLVQVYIGANITTAKTGSQLFFNVSYI